MKLEYVKPDFDELELRIEGSCFLNDTGDPTNPDVGVGGGEGGGGDDGDDNYWD